MKSYLLLFLSISIVLFACDKNKFETKPQIKVKSVNEGDVSFSGTVSVTLEATDKEGDLGKGSFTYLPQLMNKRRLQPGIPPYAPITVDIPDFPNKPKTELELHI